MSDELLAEQRRYYGARAAEYDDWWFRRGRYDLGQEGNARWATDVHEVVDALARFDPDGDVLELAAGTGLWTERLAPRARRLVAVDASEEVLALNAQRTGGERVEYVQADLFSWQSEQEFDVCFFGFWLSHVPAERFEEFWELVRAALRPGGRVFLVDSAAGDSAHSWQGDGESETRTLADGRSFRIVKRRWEPDELAARVAPLGFELDVRNTANGHFLYGSGA